MRRWGWVTQSSYALITELKVAQYFCSSSLLPLLYLLLNSTTGKHQHETSALASLINFHIFYTISRNLSSMKNLSPSVFVSSPTLQPRVDVFCFLVRECLNIEHRPCDEIWLHETRKNSKNKRTCTLCLLSILYSTSTLERTGWTSWNG